MTCNAPVLHSMMPCDCVVVPTAPTVALNNERALVFHGDSSTIQLPPNSLDAIVTDPPAGIGFMGKEWDDDKGGAENWIAWLADLLKPWFNALKPGGHALVWAIPRTSDWTMAALRRAGFEIRDQIHDVFSADVLAQNFVDGLDDEQRAAFLRLLESQASPVLYHLFGCVPLETEILTERGWLTHDQIGDGDRAVQVDAQGSASLGRVLGVSVFPFEGEMRQIKTRSTLQLLTPGHTVHAYARRGKWQRVETDIELSALQADAFTDTDHAGVTGWQLPLAARSAEFRREMPSVDHAALCGWVISEGHFHRDVSAVSIYQNEGANADKIRALLTRLGIKHSEYRRTRTDYDGSPRENVQWYIGVGEWSTWLREELAGDKPTPREDLAWLPVEQALALFEALVDGDGSRNTETSGAWYQKRSEVRAWFQTLCFRLGHRSSENEAKSAVQWSRSDTTEVQRGSHRDRWASRVPYKGEVWCPTLPQGRWVARYRGNVFVTGNTGFPKSLDVSKAIDGALGAERPVVGKAQRKATGRIEQGSGGYAYGEEYDVTSAATAAAAAWTGWGTALKPAAEHWVLCRKPLDGTVAKNVLAHGTGGLNVDACRIGTSKNVPASGRTQERTDGWGMRGDETTAGFDPSVGRWPAHVTLDEEAAALLDQQSGQLKSGGYPPEGGQRSHVATYGKPSARGEPRFGSSEGGASRFFYVAKAPRSEKDAGLDHLPKRSGGEATDREDGSAGLSNPRAGAGRTGGARNFHPTVKSIALMRWLVRLVTPPNGVVADPFGGSGSTAVAALQEGFRTLVCERDSDYLPIILGRVRHALGITTTPHP